MTKKDIAVFACRIFALYAFFQAVVRFDLLVIPLLPQYGMTGYGAFQIFITFAPTLVLLLVGVFFWRNAGKLARHLMPGVDEGQVEISSISLGDIQTVAVFVTALLVLADAIPNFFMNLAAYLEYREMNMGMTVQWYGIWFASVLKLGLGFYLLFGARSFSKVLSVISQKRSQET